MASEPGSAFRLGPVAPLDLALHGLANEVRSLFLRLQQSFDPRQRSEREARGRLLVVDPTPTHGPSCA